MVQLAQPLMTALAGAAIVPGLRSLLLYDADPATLRAAADTLAQMLALTSDRPAQVVSLAYVQSDDALWGGLAIQRRPGAPPIAWQPGLLSVELAREVTPIVIIPDLPRLGLAALRACVAMVGAEEASLERHGRSGRWRPQICWLACCAGEEVGQLSAHLLDRFALRVHCGPAAPADRAAALRALVEARAEELAPPALGEPWADRLRLARATSPATGGEDLGEALAYFPEPATSPRRPLALLRLGFAMAAMRGHAELTAAHIAEAARSLGIRDPRAAAPQAGPAPDPGAREAPAPTPAARRPLAQIAADARAMQELANTLAARLARPTADVSVELQNAYTQVYTLQQTARAVRDDLGIDAEGPLAEAYAEARALVGRVEPLALRLAARVGASQQESHAPAPPGPAEHAAPAQVPVYAGEAEFAMAAVALNPYLEDERPPEHSAESLRLPGRNRSSTASTSGPVIGVEQTTGTSDLAVVSTLLEAAKYQRWRRARLARLRARWARGRAIRPAGQAPQMRLLLAPSDLRRYRRAPVVEQMLLMLVDYTSLTGCDWPAGLMEHILWAYQQRASATLIQVGAATAGHELRAQQISVPNVLVPALDSALNAAAGRATPLAHGLDLALQALRHAVQSGRNAVQRVRLVVLSDGRGNVPLAASYAGQVSAPVRREGIDDALAVAQAIARIAHVQRVMLSPRPAQHAELPALLASALDAPLLGLRRLDDQEAAQ